ncbi:MAG: TIM barrel protein, partial [Bacteroidota bacterium]
ARLRQEILEILPKAADRGIPQIIVFSGNRNGMDDMIGLENCAVGLEPVVKAAEKAGVQITMELLNSKIDHKDYMCDHTAWGAQLAEKIGSPNFKLLYDIYHMQIMEGDVIRTIQTYHEYIGHYHTGGVPGRNEIDETQELYYPAIIKAIQETGFKGYIAQEFIPRRDDKLASLQQGIDICNVSV